MASRPHDTGADRGDPRQEGRLRDLLSGSPGPQESTAPSAPQLTRAGLSDMTTEQIVEARRAGQLAEVLGGGGADRRGLLLALLTRDDLASMTPETVRRRSISVPCPNARSDPGRRFRRSYWKHGALWHPMVIPLPP